MVKPEWNNARVRRYHAGITVPPRYPVGDLNQSAPDHPEVSVRVVSNDDLHFARLVLDGNEHRVIPPRGCCLATGEPACLAIQRGQLLDRVRHDGLHEMALRHDAGSTCPWGMAILLVKAWSADDTIRPCD